MLFRKRAQRKRRRIRKLRLLALMVVLLLLAAASFSVGLITAIAGQLPSLDPKLGGTQSAATNLLISTQRAGITNVVATAATSGSLSAP